MNLRLAGLTHDDPTLEFAKPGKCLLAPGRAIPALYNQNSELKVKGLRLVEQTIKAKINCAGLWKK